MLRKRSIGNEEARWSRAKSNKNRANSNCTWGTSGSGVSGEPTGSS